MIGFLIWLLVLLIVLYILKLVLDAVSSMFGIPATVQKIIMLVIGLIALLYILDHIGMIGTPYTADYGYRAYR